MKIIIAVALFAATLAARAEPPTVIPVYEVQCVNEDKANLKNATIGGAIAGAGAYSAAKIAGSRNSGAWGLGAAALGALIGAGTNTKEGACVNKQVLIGHRILSVQNGKIVETFKAVQNVAGPR